MFSFPILISASGLAVNKDDQEARRSLVNLSSARGSPVSDRRRLLKFGEKQKEPPPDLSL